MNTIILYILLIPHLSWVNETSIADTDIPENVPIVFFIGEHEKYYEKLIKEHQLMLFGLAKNDVNATHELWINFLANLEEFSNKNNVDIKGVKLWMNVFWNEDGTIRHMVFYPKPNSINIDYEEVKNLFKKFASIHKMDVKSSVKYAHYGSVAFPVFGKSLKNSEK